MTNVDHPINIPLHYKSQPIPADNGAVKDLVGLNFKKVTESLENDVIVNFYAPWCPWSQRLAPTWLQFGERLKGSASVVVAKFDGTQNEVAGLHLNAYPTVALYRAKDNDVRYYREGVRTVEAFMEFLKNNAAIPFMNPETGELHYPSSLPPKDHALDVPELNDDNYESVFDADKNYLVLFYAPWCEHSQEMFETWEKVAIEYKFIDSVKVYQMDAHEAKKPGLSIFPTIKLFPAGSDAKDLYPQGIPFKGKETNIKNIAGFVAENAKRTPKEEEILKRVSEGVADYHHAEGDDGTLGQTLIIVKEEL
jgi:protein disulfide-isomerase A6